METCHMYHIFQHQGGTYYDTNPQRLIEMFKTSEEHGLNDDDVAQRQQQYGLNVLPVR